MGLRLAERFKKNRPVIEGPFSITHLEKVRVSASGNPRWWVTFDDGVKMPTASDAEFARHLHGPEWEGAKVMVTSDSAGRITDLRFVISHLEHGRWLILEQMRRDGVLTVDSAHAEEWRILDARMGRSYQGARL